MVTIAGTHNSFRKTTTAFHKAAFHKALARQVAPIPQPPKMPTGLVDEDFIYKLIAPFAYGDTGTFADEESVAKAFGPRWDTAEYFEAYETPTARELARRIVKFHDRGHYILTDTVPHWVDGPDGKLDFVEITTGIYGQPYENPLFIRDTPPATGPTQP